MSLKVSHSNHTLCPLRLSLRRRTALPPEHFLLTAEPAFNSSRNSSEVSMEFAQGDSANSHAERVPLHFRCLGMGCEETEYTTETVKIWVSGFLMRSRRELTAGTILYLRMRVPIEISGSPFSELCSIGRVVSEHELDDGTVGYSVHIERAATKRRTLELPL